MLESRLGDGFAYQGYDLQPQVPSAIRLDLRRELPEREFDVVFCLGLLEYLPDLEGFLAGVGRISPLAVVSYVIADSPDELSERERMDRGWVNHYSRAQFPALCKRAGHVVRDSLLIEEGRTVLCLLESRHRRVGQ